MTGTKNKLTEYDQSAKLCAGRGIDCLKSQMAADRPFFIDIVSCIKGKRIGREAKHGRSFYSLDGH